MEVLAHSHGITVYAGSQGPRVLTALQLIRFAAARSNRAARPAWPHGFITPLMPDPNP